MAALHGTDRMMKPLRLPLSLGPVTGDMISPPLSPNSDLDYNTISPAFLSALEYVSRKLQHKGVHATFVVIRDKPLPIGHGYNLYAHPISPLPEPTCRLFNHAIGRAAKKFGLCRDWMSRRPLCHDKDAGPNMPNWEYIVFRSVLQNSVLFSQEGLTLLNVDRILTFKQQLSVLSRGSIEPIPENIYRNSCIWLLRQIMRETHGRPFTWGFFHCAYDHLHVRDDLLVSLAREYAARYSQDAIVLPAAKTRPKKMPERARAGHLHRRGWAASPAGLKKSPSRARIGPKTPHSASDVTPITRSEWKLLMHRAMGGIKIVPVGPLE